MKSITRRSLNWRLVGKVIFGSVYVLLGAEIFLCIFAPVPILPRYVCAGPHSIRANEPNRSYWHSTPEYRINIRTNSKGVRADKEIPYKTLPGVKRIVLLGDSFGMGYGVNLENTFSELMKKSLQTKGIKCEVVNLSVSGHGTAEQLIMLANEGLKYQPDLVLLAWHGSDIADNIRSNLYKIEDGRLVRMNNTYLPGVRIREVLFQFAIYRFVAERSHLYSCVRENVARFIKYTMLPIVRNLSNTNKPSQNPSIDTVENAKSYRDYLARALLEEMKQKCASNGTNFLIFDIPAKLTRTEFKSKFPYGEKNGKCPFQVFSPIELFKQQSSKKIYYEKSHGHFTPLGCHIIGQGLADFILCNNLLKEPMDGLN